MITVPITRCSGDVWSAVTDTCRLVTYRAIGCPAHITITCYKNEYREIQCRFQNTPSAKAEGL